MKLKWFLIFGLIILTLNSFGQTKDSTETEKLKYIDPMTYPSFPGGQAALIEYIEKNLNWTHGQLTVEGIVYVEFFVDIDGKINDVKIIRGLCESCDKAALILVRKMPNWTAGKENGKPIKTKMVLPIKFRLG